MLMASDGAVQWLEALPDPCMLLAQDGRVVEWNRAAETTYGHAAAEVQGRCVDEFLLPAAQAQQRLARTADALRDGSCTYESIRRRRDGSLLHVDVTLKVLERGPGQPPCVLVAEKDVTRIKVAHDARLMEARFRELLESTPDGIVMANLTGHIVIANSQAERLFGYEPGELRGHTVDELLPQRFRHAHVRHRSDFFLQPRGRAMGSGLDLWGLRKDGTEFPVEISLNPLRTEETSFVMSAIRDISERKRFERALQEKNDELARANAAKDRFLASMSHELRTPLNAIIGFTGTMLMRLPGPLTPDQDRQLRTVQTSARHLLSLINDLLDIAKIEAGKAEVNRETVDPAALLDDVVATLVPQAEAKGLVLRATKPARVRTAQLDRRMLQQIVLNLASNAVKFTDAGEVEIVLRQDALHDQIDVRDTGCGISAEDQARLFGAFVRVNEVRRPHEGTGLGLHLSHKLAQALGGTLTCRSVVGEGSVFTLTLPRA